MPDADDLKNEEQPEDYTIILHWRHLWYAVGYLSWIESGRLLERLIKPLPTWSEVLVLLSGNVCIMCICLFLSLQGKPPGEKPPIREVMKAMPFFSALFLPLVLFDWASHSWHFLLRFLVPIAWLAVFVYGGDWYFRRSGKRTE